MEDGYRLVVDTKEFQQKVLDYISSDEIDKMISNTVFAEKPECKSAIAHGMIVASMLTSYCTLMYVKEYKEEEERMLSANEARAKTQNNIDDCVRQELKRLDEQISEAIAGGEFSIRNDGSLQPDTQKKLEELGYEVKTGTQYNESYYSVSWK